MDAFSLLSAPAFRQPPLSRASNTVKIKNIGSQAQGVEVFPDQKSSSSQQIQTSF